MNNINKKFHPRCFEIMDLYVDIFEEIKNNGIKKINFIELLDNIYNSGPLIIQLYELILSNRHILSKYIDLSKFDNISKDSKISRLSKETLIEKLQNNINNFNYNKFNINPITSGPISQTHFYGKDIIQIINLKEEDIWHLDIDILKEIINIEDSPKFESNFRAMIKLLKNINLLGYIDKISNQINLLNENKNIQFIKKLNIDELVIPDVKYISSNILVKSYYNGIKIFDINDVKQIINYKVKTFVVLLKMLNKGIFLLNFNENNIIYSEKIYILDYNLISTVSNNDVIKIKELLNKIIQNKTIDLYSNLFNNIFEKKFNSIESFLESEIKVNEKVIQFFIVFLLIEAGISNQYNINFLEEVLNYLNKNNLRELI